MRINVIAVSGSIICTVRAVFLSIGKFLRAGRHYAVKFRVRWEAVYKGEYFFWHLFMLQQFLFCLNSIGRTSFQTRPSTMNNKFFTDFYLLSPNCEVICAMI